MNISTKLKFGNISFGCLRQVGCLIEVTANTGLTVLRIEKEASSLYFVSLLILYFNTEPVFRFGIARLNDVNNVKLKHVL